MVGIKFQIRNEHDVVLDKIFENIDLKNYFLKITNEEVFDEKRNNFFEQQIYTSLKFKNLIKLRKHYPVFLTLQLYKDNKNMVEIQNYDNYLNSHCELLLYIIDNIFVEIYSKNENYLKAIKHNALKNKYVNVQDINDFSKFSLYY